MLSFTMADNQFTSSSAPHTYDELFVPRLLQPWGEVLVKELKLRPGESVLDVACGPGTLSRICAAQVGLAGRVVGVDLSPHMLAVAREKTGVPIAARITYKEASADALPVETASFDAVVCQQGLQFFPDRIAALREMKRALRPVGRLAVAVWGPIEKCGQFHALLRAFEQAGLSAELRQELSLPFSFPDAAALRKIISGAGFSEVTVETRTRALRFEGGVRQVVASLYGMPLAAEILALSQERRAALFAAAAQELAPFLVDGAVVTEMTANFALAS